MNILFAILAALACGGFSAWTVFLFSRRARQQDYILDEIVQLEADLDRARSHAFRIQQAQQERNLRTN
jgi:hypothetical protein